MTTLITQISTVTSESLTRISYILQAPRNILAAENKRSITQQMLCNDKSKHFNNSWQKRNVFLGNGHCFNYFCELK